MFSYLSKEGRLELRLPPEEREAFLKKYNAKLCEAYGVVQKEYVEVPDSLLASTAALKKYSTPVTPGSAPSNRKPRRERKRRNRNCPKQYILTPSPEPRWPFSPLN
jgi:hypothetical protein